MRPQITGTVLPVLEIGLDPGDMVVAATGELAWMTSNVRMNTTTGTAGSSGLWGAVTRAVSGGGLFMTEFVAEGGPGGVAFAPKIPGQIVPVEVQSNRGYLIHRHGFLAATQGVQLTTALQRSFGAGIFGGEGFILQHLSGTCHAWVALGGEIVTNELAPGETLQVHPGMSACSRTASVSTSRPSAASKTRCSVAVDSSWRILLGRDGSGCRP
jgi:uncharacterized protein (AIM24 family)